MRMKKIKKTYNKILQFILYRIHLKRFKLSWMPYEINKKQFKQYLDVEIWLIYDKIADRFEKHYNIQKV